MRRKTISLIVSLLVSFVGLRSALAGCDVTESSYGAVGDGVHDDRAGIQAAINDCVAMGDLDVFVPFGVFKLSRAGSAYYNLVIPAGVRFHGTGMGSVLVQAPGQGPSVRMLQVTGNGVTVADMLIDGNKANQTVDEHRSGIFAVGAVDLTVERMTMRNFTGDGAYVYTGSSRVLFRDNVIYANDRDGIALTQDTNGVIIYGNRIYGNAFQQIDSEPGGTATINEVSIFGNYLETGNDYAITVSGPSSTTRSRGWTISGNIILGGIFVVWADDVTITANRFKNHTTKPCVTFWRRTVGGVVSANDCKMLQTTTAAGVPGIDVVGTGPGHIPERIVISDNVITVDHPMGWGVRCTGVFSCVIRGNTMRGAGVASPYGAGVYVRATSLTDATRSILIQGNLISDFGSAGVIAAGNVVGVVRAEMKLLNVTGNVFDDDSVTPTMTTAVRIDPSVIPNVMKIDNDRLGGVIY